MACCAVSARAANEAGATAESRGQMLYLANCSMCHGATGDGIKDTYPPLAKSDYVAANREGMIRPVVSGLSGEITVNGHKYRGQMPPVMLDDAQAADVLTFVLNSWGNGGGAVTADEVKGVRAKTNFKTYADLKAAADFQPVPAPPEGFTIRELVRLPDFGVRIASDGKGGKFYILGKEGGVWRFDPASGNLKQIIWAGDFGDRKPGGISTLGFTRDAQGRLWITVNQRVDSRPLVMNECAIYRTSGFDADGDPVAPKRWFQTSYPWGIGPYNHGLSHIRFGPDGMLYLSSGSRTDGGEAGQIPWLGAMGEVDITATMWRLDPRSDQPKIEIVARGIRNAFSFAWDGAGNLFTVSNGPDAHAPEEMDFIVPPKAGEPPRHHGFPYQFGDAPPEHKWYAHTPMPPAPEGVTYVRPVLNLGPAGIMGGQPTSTFNAHTSPAGLTWLGAEWPASVRNGFLVTRIGSFLLGPGEDEEHGFDVLHLKMERRADGSWAARTHTFLAPLGRPIDIHVAEPGKLYVLEYTRPTHLKNSAGWLPGRILELNVKK